MLRKNYKALHFLMIFSLAGFFLLPVASCYKQNKAITNILLTKSEEDIASIIYEFAKNKNYPVKIQLMQNGSHILTQLALEKPKLKTDIILFLNSQLSNQLENERPLIRKEKIGLSYLTILSNQNTKIDSLNDLINIAGEVAWPNPITSSEGLDFVLWTYSVYSEIHWIEFWKKIAQKVRFYAKNWVEAYEWYDSRLVKAMLGYHIDNAYNVYNNIEKKSRINILKEGWIQRFDHALLLKNTKEGHDFMDFFVSEKFQEFVPLSCWMIPVSIPQKKLPQIFKQFVPLIDNDDQSIELGMLYSQEESQHILSKWEKIWLNSKVSK